MKIDETSSNRITYLRFTLIVSIVLIHADSTAVVLQGVSLGATNQSLYSQLIRDFISQGVARIAVPLFFILAGYLYFNNLKLSVNTYQTKLKSRVKSLLIPLIIWNSLIIGLYAIAQALPPTQTLFSGKNTPISSYSLLNYIDAIFGITQLPIALQFWFIKDLFIMTILSPIFYFILKIIPNAFLIVIFCMWYTCYWPVYTPSVESVFFFYLGAYWTHFNKSLFWFDKYGKKILLIYLPILIIDVLTKNYAFNGYIHRLGIMFGLPCTLYVTLFISKYSTLHRTLVTCSAFSFFVFAGHQPFMNLFKKIVFKVFQPQSDLFLLILYFSIPITVIIILILIYKLIKTIFPRVTNIITGNR